MILSRRIKINRKYRFIHPVGDKKEGICPLFLCLQLCYTTTMTVKKHSKALMIQQLLTELDFHLEQGSVDKAKNTFDHFFANKEDRWKFLLLSYWYVGYHMPNSIQGVFLDFITPEFLYAVVKDMPQVLESERDEEPFGDFSPISCKLFRLLTKGYQLNLTKKINEFKTSIYGVRAINYVKLKIPDIELVPVLKYTPNDMEIKQ